MPAAGATFLRTVAALLIGTLWTVPGAAVAAAELVHPSGGGGDEQYFSEPEARRQLDTAIDWSRYAELFAFDDDSGQLYLEKESES